MNTTRILSLAAITVLFGAGCSLFNTGPTVRPYAKPIPTVPMPVKPPPAQVFEDTSKSIRVTNLTEGQLLTNGSIVEGSGVAFESTISWRLEDSGGNTIAHGYTMTAAPDMGIPGPYRIPVLFDRIPATTTGTMLVFENSAKDGSEIHVVKVPVSLSTDTQTVKVFFGNSKMNPNAIDCTLVYPTDRIVPVGDTPFIAVHALLKGPTAQEKTAGYYTSIPEGVTIQNTVGADGFAALDFNYALQQDVAGSCRVSAIRSQIDMTSSQEQGGRILPITVYGRANDVLQP